MSDHDRQCEFMLSPPDMNRLGLCRCKERFLAAEIESVRSRTDLLQQVIDDRDKAAGFESLSPETRAAFRASVQEIDAINLRRCDALAAENAALRSTIDDLTAGEIHTCHDHCQRTACILRRENTALRARLAHAEACLAEKHLRLAEAEIEERRAAERRLRAEITNLRAMLDEASPVVACARCGVQDRIHRMFIEEGGEWECPACWERCEAEEMAVTDKSPARDE